jgi:hypothetical protein
VSALPSESTPDQAHDGSPVRRAGLPLRLAYFGGVVLAAVFLVMSIVSWNPVLGALSLALALLLYKNIDLVGGLPDQAPARRSAQN